MLKGQENLLWAHMKTESDFVNNQISSANARGLMQIKVKTFSGLTGINSKDPKIFTKIMDARENIFAAAKLMDLNRKYFNNNIVQMISAYHAGSGGTRIGIQNSVGGFNNRSKIASEPNIIAGSEDTKTYVNRVLNKYYEYNENYLFQGDSSDNKAYVLSQDKIPVEKTELQIIREKGGTGYVETYKGSQKSVMKEALKSKNLRKNKILNKEDKKELKNQNKNIRSNSPLPDRRLLESENNNQGDSTDSIYSFDNQVAPLPPLNKF